MAANEYIIRILYETPDGSSVGTAPISSSAADAGRGAAEAKPSPGVSAASAVTSIGNTMLQMESQRISTVTGSSQLAKKQSLNAAAVKGIMDVGLSAAGGASVAASLGSAIGLSTGAGAVIGVAMTALNKVLDIAANVADLNNKATVEKSSINATKARASISWDRSRER